jgi:hypothetical protein
VISTSSDNVALTTNDDGSVYFPHDVTCATKVTCDALKVTGTLEATDAECQELQVVNGLVAGSVQATELKQGASTLNNLLALREGAFEATLPLRKVVSAAGVSLEFDSGADLTVNEVTAQSVLVGGANVVDLLAEREQTFTALSPLIKGFDTDGQANLSLDATASVVVSSVVASTVVSSLIDTSFVTALNSNGIGFFPKDSSVAFAVQNDRSCKAFRGLEVVGDLSASQSVTGQLVQAGVFKSDILRPNVNPGVTVEGSALYRQYFVRDPILPLLGRRES